MQACNSRAIKLKSLVLHSLCVLAKVFSQLRLQASTFGWEALSVAPSLLSLLVVDIPLVFALQGWSRGASGVLDAPCW